MTKLRNTFLTLGTAVMLNVALISPASASEPTSAPTVEPATITAPLSKLEFEKPDVSSTPASLVEAPVVAIQSESELVVETPTVTTTLYKPEAKTTETNLVPVAKKSITPAPVAAPVATVTPAQKPVASSGKGATIAAAAYAQIGVAQDCTRLATNALAAAGIHHHGWPASYMALGTITTTPVPGDLIYYDNAGAGVPHIAVYVGNGMAIHGGWNGGTTALFSANLGSGPVYIHV